MWAGSDPTTDYRDSNVSPNFPYAAQVWVAQWQAQSGQQLDGAITLDPTALSYLLRVTGPATLPDGTKVTPRNVVVPDAEHRVPEVRPRGQRRAQEVPARAWRGR